VVGSCDHGNEHLGPCIRWISSLAEGLLAFNDAICSTDYFMAHLTALSVAQVM
jgi:hypothetical protein